MSTLEWDRAEAAIRCRVCGDTGIGDVVLRFGVAATGSRHPAVRCRMCGSIELLDRVSEFGATDLLVDQQVEAGAGVGILASLVDVAGEPGGRLLDVGTAYGFAVAYADFVGWRATGIEPGYAGRRGAEELDIDLRLGTLEVLEEDDRFDAVLSSEVLEHVADPAGFLAAIRDRLTPDGVLVLTTPDAAWIRPDAPPAAIWSVLSPGLHHFLASADGLREMLQRAGFRSISIEPFGYSHRVIARLGDGDTAPGPERDRIGDFYRSVGARAGGSLAVGMWSRAFRLSVARGDFAEARGALEPLQRAFRDRHQVDPLDPRDVARYIDTASEPSAALPGTCFALGMTELLEGDPRAAMQRFEHAISSGRRWQAFQQGPDADSDDVIAQSAFHRLIAAARVEPGVALAESAAQGDLETARIFVELVSAGHLDAATELADRVGGFAVDLAARHDATPRRAGLDALYCLGTLFIQRGDPAGTTWLEACLIACDAAPQDEHVARLRTASVEALGRVAVPDPSPEPPAETFHMIDVYWSDPHGAFVDGWLHVGGDPGTDLTIGTGDRRVAVERHRRSDLRTHWPDSDTVEHSGFRAYLPGVPAERLEFTGVFAGTRRSIRIDVPDRRLPELGEEGDEHEVRARIETLGATAPSGPVLSIGARASDDSTPVFSDVAFPGREVVGFDIHAGHRVDIVGDAHRLSDLVDPGAFSIIYSASLLEHVSAPWLVAREIAKVLPVGGLAIHVVPWLWPTHSQPNDFWRISDAGLSQLFSPELGFEVLGSGGYFPAAVIPSPRWRTLNPDLATHLSPTTSWIVARKVSDRWDRFDWPYDAAAGADLARDYPVDGIESRTRERLN